MWIPHQDVPGRRSDRPVNRLSRPTRGLYGPGGAWTDRNQDSEKEKAITTVTQCQAQLRLARENARGAGEVSRRAIRGVEAASDALREATRRLDRMEPAAPKAG